VLPEASMRNIQYYGSPVKDVVNKTSTEPQAAHLEGFFRGFKNGQWLAHYLLITFIKNIS
jgi:hypothetical protein